MLLAKIFLAISEYLGQKRLRRCIASQPGHKKNDNGLVLYLLWKHPRAEAAGTDAYGSPHPVFGLPTFAGLQHHPGVQQAWPLFDLKPSHQRSKAVTPNFF